MPGQVIIVQRSSRQQPCRTRSILRRHDPQRRLCPVRFRGQIPRLLQRHPTKLHCRTTTIPAGVKKMFQTARKANDIALDNLKPGIPGYKIDQLARNHITKQATRIQTRPRTRTRKIHTRDRTIIDPDGPTDTAPHHSKQSRKI